MAIFDPTIRISVRLSKEQREQYAKSPKAYLNQFRETLDRDIQKGGKSDD